MKTRFLPLLLALMLLCGCAAPEAPAVPETPEETPAEEATDPPTIVVLPTEPAE